MYELKQVAENSFYIESPSKIGLIRLNEKDVCLIDSGNDKDSGRKIRQILDSKGWNLKAIYNTHSNADHIGGNNYLQKQTLCKVYAPGIEYAFTRDPILEPSFLYGGFPPKDIRHKFLVAQGSNVEYMTDSCLPSGVEPIQLPGHFFDMVGFKSKDDVIYLADCLFSTDILNKYHLTFIYDVGAYLNTLEFVKGLQAKMFIPAHADVTEDISLLAQINIDKVYEIADKILSICDEPICFELILQKLFSIYDLTMTFDQYVLVGSTVRSYLSWLKDTDMINSHFENNMLLWKRK